MEMPHTIYILTLWEYTELDMNKNISVDEYNVSYFSDIFEHHWLHIDLNPYKDELLKNLIIHDDNNFAESYWKNGTIIFYLHEMFTDNGEIIDKNSILRYFSEWNIFDCCNHYHDELKKYVTYNKNNCIFMSVPPKSHYDEIDNPYTDSD